MDHGECRRDAYPGARADDEEPMLWSMYWLNYLDRNAIALARINDLEEDLNLDSVQYSTCVSILFVGYLLGGVPANMFLTRTRPSKFLV